MSCLEELPLRDLQNSDADVDSSTEDIPPVNNSPLFGCLSCASSTKWCQGSPCEILLLSSENHRPELGVR